MKYLFLSSVLVLSIIIASILPVNSAFAQVPVEKWNATFSSASEVIGVGGNKLLVQEMNGFSVLNENGDLIWNATYSNGTMTDIAADDKLIAVSWNLMGGTPQQNFDILNASDGTVLFHKNSSMGNYMNLHVDNGTVCVYENNMLLNSYTYNGSENWSYNTSGLMSGLRDVVCGQNDAYLLWGDAVMIVGLSKLENGIPVWNTTIENLSMTPTLRSNQQYMTELPNGGVAIGIPVNNNMDPTQNYNWNVTVYAYSSGNTSDWSQLIEGKGQISGTPSAFKSTSTGDVVFGIRGDNPIYRGLFSVSSSGIRFNASQTNEVSRIYTQGSDIYVQTSTGNNIALYSGFGSMLWNKTYPGTGVDMYVNEDGMIFNLWMSGYTYLSALVPPRAYIDGDIAPFQNSNGRLTSDDALVALQCAIGKLTPDLATMTDGDVAPLDNSTGVLQPNPDGLLNVGDAVVLLKGSVGQYAWEGMALLIGQQYMGNIVTDASTIPNAHGYQFDLLIGDGGYDPADPAYGLVNATGALPSGSTLDGSYEDMSRTMTVGLMSGSPLGTLSEAANLGTNRYLLLKFPIPENVVADSLNKIAIINDSDPMNGFVDNLGAKITTPPVSRTFYLTNENI